MILLIWQAVAVLQIVPDFMLPSPVSVGKALVNDFPLLMQHARYTVLEAMLGLTVGILIGFLCAVFMDHFDIVYKALYPIIIITQTIPTVAIAPLLILWLGYEMAPKVVLIVIVTFFPISIGLLEGFRSADTDMIRLMQSMGATRIQIFRHIKLPSAMGQFFSSLRISVSYSIVGAVISEWLGGYYGLGVYMTRVKSAYAFDRMFAVIIAISALSLVLMWLVDLVQKVCMPWENVK
ncbi:MAG TPA: ABC transporter permease [Candidatus Fimousia stercorigallinarum]|nr:ABC transporter permease [Candidatus Fimousia stercorigallinarum]